jgi:hypothetical protein
MPNIVGLNATNDNRPRPKERIHKLTCGGDCRGFARCGNVEHDFDAAVIGTILGLLALIVLILVHFAPELDLWLDHAFAAATAVRS